MTLPSATREFLWRHAWTGLGILALFITARLPALTGWDDAFYVGQLTSAVADRDLLLQDDLLAFPRPLAGRFRSITTVLPSGALQNTFSVGFAVVHGAYAWPFLALSRERIGEGLRWVLALGSLLFLALTALSTVRLCERWGVSPHMARLGTGLALASGPLALYGTRHYLNSHLLGAACVTLLLLGALRWMEDGRMRDALLVGLCSGLLVINRWQDAIVLVALGPLLAASLWRGEGRRPTFSGAALAVGACVAVGTLQLLAWRAQFSTWLLVPQGSGYMHWSHPAIVPLIVSPYHGMVPWAPGLALGLVAVVVWAAKDDAVAVKRLRSGLLLALPLFIYFSAAPRDWWGGGSFGPRRLATLVPIAALGLAVILERLGFWGRVAIAGTLLLWWTIAVSAYFSGFDDLWLFFRGTPGWFSPLNPSPSSEIGWIDTWGPFHALKPGFTFTDHPHNPDRLVGLAACCSLGPPGGLGLGSPQAQRPASEGRRLGRRVMDRRVRSMADARDPAQQ